MTLASSCVPARFWDLQGLVGAGRSETARLLFGADKLYSGEIYVEGKKKKD